MSCAPADANDALVVLARFFSWKLAAAANWHALARFAGKGDFRGNLAKGGSSKGVPLSERDRWICSQVAPELKKRGILFAGLDVIGDWLSEVNVTSPTCIRELDKEFGLNIAGQLFDGVEAMLK